MLPRLGDPLPVEVDVLPGPELFARGVAVLQRFPRKRGAEAIAIRGTIRGERPRHGGGRIIGASAPRSKYHSAAHPSASPRVWLYLPGHNSRMPEAIVFHCRDMAERSG